MQRQFGGAFKPLNPAAFDDKIGFAALADAVAAQSAEDMQAAVAALQGADLCYLFAPLQQQSAAINWQAIASMGQGLRPAVSLLGQAASAVPSSQTDATAAAMAAVPAGISARHVTQAHLQDAVLLAGHSSQLYRCKGVASDVTPTTPCGFEWSSPADSNSSLRKRTKHTADNHAQYYSERYGVQGLRGDLPMLQVTQSGRQKAMQLMQYPLKPPTLQRGVKRAGAAHRPTDLTTAEAAAAACDFSFLQRAHQAGTQQEDEQAYKLYLPLELCWVLPLPAHQWQELQLLPAFMYRIDSLLRLQQAQQQLFPVDATDGGSGSLPPQLLMATVTAPGAGEVFDMEGLEYLGDVVLKMLTTNYLLQPEVSNYRLCGCCAAVCCVAYGASLWHLLCCAGRPWPLFDLTAPLLVRTLSQWQLATLQRIPCFGVQATRSRQTKGVLVLVLLHRAVCCPCRSTMSTRTKESCQ